MRRALIAPLLAIVLLARAAAADDAKPNTQPFELKDGDRVAFVGGTFFELEAKSGYIETALTTRFPDRNVTFRNFGYGGDTVTCDARNLCAGWTNFGPPDQGFSRLKALIAEFKPTVVFVAYGMTESFDGEKGLPAFVQNYDKLLDMLKAAAGGEPRFVLIGPTYHEDMGRPLPDPAPHNENLKQYLDAVRQIADKHAYRFVDVFSQLSWASKEFSPTRLTSNGIHLTPLGYYFATTAIQGGLGLAMPLMELDLDAGGKVVKSAGVKVSDVKRSEKGLTFDATFSTLSLPPVSSEVTFSKPRGVAGNFSETSLSAVMVTGVVTLRISGLGAGRYACSSGGHDLDEGSAEQWAAGRPFSHGPAEDQGEQLRRLIVAKNVDFFNYWRPENDTYILGYRKKEQGRNAVEMPQFKALAEAKDAEIAKLRVPRPVAYTLERAK